MINTNQKYYVQSVVNATFKGIHESKLPIMNFFMTLFYEPDTICFVESPIA